MAMFKSRFFNRGKKLNCHLYPLSNLAISNIKEMGSALIASFLSMTIIDKIRKSVNIIAKLKRQVKAQSLICVVLIFSVPDAEFISKSHILITLTTVTVDNVKILCKNRKTFNVPMSLLFCYDKIESGWGRLPS